MSAFAPRPPQGWHYIQSWSDPVRRPLYYRHTPAGTQWIFRNELDMFELEMRGYTGILHKNPSLEKCAEYADWFKAASNMRVAGLSPKELTENMKALSIKALNSLARGSLSELEKGREALGLIEAVVREIRTRMVEADDKESTASRAERLAAALYRNTFTAISQIQLGNHELAFEAIEDSRKILLLLEREAELLRDKYKSLREAMS